MLKRWLLFISLCLAAGVVYAATSQQYTLPGTSKLFADSAQAEDVTITLSALASGAGRCSARYDKGSGAQPSSWEWRGHIQLTGTNVVTDVVEVYISMSDGTNPDGEIGTSDAALATDKRRNLHFAGLLRVDQTTTNTTMTGSNRIFIPTRYFSLCIWNAASLNFKTDTAVHGFVLTPLPFQMQAS